MEELGSHKSPHYPGSLLVGWKKVDQPECGRTRGSQTIWDWNPFQRKGQTKTLSAMAISKITIYTSGCNDSWIWTMTNSGTISVKYAYWLSKGSFPPTNRDNLRGCVWKKKKKKFIKGIKCIYRRLMQIVFLQGKNWKIHQTPWWFVSSV